jgi:hypothetical protein
MSSSTSLPSISQSMLTHKNNFKVADQDRGEDIPTSPGSMCESEFILEKPRMPSSTPSRTNAAKRKAEQDRQARDERNLRRSRGPEVLDNELRQMNHEQKATPRMPAHPRKRMRTPSETRDAGLRPRTESTNVSSDSEDKVPEEKPRGRIPAMETSTFWSCSTLAAQTFPVSAMRSKVNLGGNNTSTREISHPVYLTLGAIPSGVIVSDLTIRGVVRVNFTDPDCKAGKTPKIPANARNRRRTSLPDIPRNYEAALPSSARPSTAAGSYANIRRFTPINSNQNPGENLSMPTQRDNRENENVIKRHYKDQAIEVDADADADTDAWDPDEDGSAVPDRDEDPLLDLDEKAEVMLSQIINLVRSPREWLDFLDSGDYRISRGSLVVKGAGHVNDAKDILHYLIHKINDNPAKKYEPLVNEYEAIWVDTNTAGDPKSFRAPQIWEPYSVLMDSDTEKNLDNTPFADKVAVCMALWKDIVDKLPFLFLDRRLKTAPRHWSFVVLLVLTCVPQPDLCEALGITTNYTSGLRKQVFDLLDHLCNEWEEYKHFTAPEITEIWDHLHNKFLVA